MCTTTDTTPSNPVVSKANVNNIKVKLYSAQWEKFAAIATIEMRTEAKGRCLFPILQYNVSGLNPEGTYLFGVRMKRISGELMWDHECGWVEKRPDKSDLVAPAESNEVTTCAMNGAFWMQGDGVNFSGLKIYTIGKKAKYTTIDSNMIHLHFNRMYRPVLRLFERISEGELRMRGEWTFPVAQFINVSNIKNGSMRTTRNYGNKHTRGDYKKKMESKKENLKVQEQKENLEVQEQKENLVVQEQKESLEVHEQEPAGAVNVTVQELPDSHEVNIALKEFLKQIFGATV